MDIVYAPSAKQMSDSRMQLQIAGEVGRFCRVQLHPAEGELRRAWVTWKVARAQSGHPAVLGRGFAGGGGQQLISQGPTVRDVWAQGCDGHSIARKLVWGGGMPGQE